jgi:uncharacterized membrane protein YdjX (TVP38/TMEM64 family)
MSATAEGSPAWQRVSALGLLAGIVGLTLLSWSSDGIVATLVSPSIDAGAKLEAVRLFVLSAGWAAPIAYVAAVVVEVIVAPLPGLILYAPGGAIFGGFLGGLLSLLGNVIGAAGAFFIVRALGGARVGKHVGSGALARIEKRLDQHGVAVIFLLRVNPLTSSDLVSYAAGLTSMPAWKLVVGTAAGMAPLCFAQAYASAGLFDRYPWLIYGLAILAAGYFVAAVALVTGVGRGRRRRGFRAASAPGGPSAGA